MHSLSPDLEDKLRAAVKEMRSAVLAMRNAHHELAVAIDQIIYDSTVCAQLSNQGEAAYALRRRAMTFRKNLNRLDISSIMIPAERLADAAWENRGI